MGSIAEVQDPTRDGSLVGRLQMQQTLLASMLCAACSSASSHGTSLLADVVPLCGNLWARIPHCDSVSSFLSLLLTRAVFHGPGRLVCSDAQCTRTLNPKL